MNQNPVTDKIITYCGDLQQLQAKYDKLEKEHTFLKSNLSDIVCYFNEFIRNSGEKRCRCRQCYSCAYSEMSWDDDDDDDDDTFFICSICDGQYCHDEECVRNHMKECPKK